MSWICNRHLKFWLRYPHSRPEINRMRSEAMRLGSKQNCTDTFFTFVWKRRLDILGAYFTWDKCASQVEENGRDGWKTSKE